MRNRRAHERGVSLSWQVDVVGEIPGAGYERRIFAADCTAPAAESEAGSARHFGLVHPATIRHPRTVMYERLNSC